MARSILMVLAVVTIVNASCPSGWVYNENTGHCYKFFGDRQHGGMKTRNDAMVACRGFGAYLVAIEDEPEAAFLTAQSDVHHAGHDDLTLPRYWTGAELVDNVWYWNTGSDGMVPMTDLLWALGEPEAGMTFADFVVFHEDGMGWSPNGRTIGGIHTVTRPGKFPSAYVCEKPGL